MLIKFDTSKVEAYTEALSKLNAEALKRVRQTTVNAVALTVREEAIKSTHGALNLTKAYIESRIQRDEARGANASARVTSEMRGATLQRFGAEQRTKAVNWSNQAIAQMGVTVGGWPFWTERTGDDSRGIPANRKAYGVAVDVNRKGSKRIKSAFTMPLNGNNGFGVFRREGGKVKHLYGPSVYQTFRRYIEQHATEIEDALESEFTDQLNELVQEALP